MTPYKHIEVASVRGSAGDAAVVRFRHRKILDATMIQELGEELFSLVEKDKQKNIVLNFVDVNFLSSAALNELLMLHKKTQAVGSRLHLCHLSPEIFEIFAVTRLTRVFAIKATEQDALVGD